MADIYLGYVILCGLSVLSLVITRYLTRRMETPQLNLAAAATLLLSIVYTLFIWENLVLAKFLPFSNLIVIGNWYPIFAGIFAGIVNSRFDGDLKRQSIALVALLLIGGFSAIYPILGSAPQCQDRWSPNEICYQTTDMTCTAACGATLLTHHGIPTSEQEMAESCFTRKGTSWKGLYRGLKIKTKNEPMQVVVKNLTIEDLKELNQPVILRIGESRWSTVSVALGNPKNWNQGTLHSVIYLGTVDDRIYIADPNPEIGIEIWKAEQLERLWDGHSAYLVSTEQRILPNMLGLNTQPTMIR